MTETEARLEQALKAGDSAVRDPMFRIALLVRRERAAFRRRTLTAVALALGAAIVAAAVLGTIGLFAGTGVISLTATAAMAIVLIVLLTARDAGTLAALRRLVAHASRWKLPGLYP